MTGAPRPRERRGGPVFFDAAAGPRDDGARTAPAKIPAMKNAPAFPASPLVARLVELAIEEDLAGGDLTGESCVPETAKATATVVAREPLILCGAPLLAMVAARVAPDAVLKVKRADGEKLQAGDVVAQLAGPARELLRGERICLNFLMHLSGIASLTADIARINPAVRLLDTRKTRPGWRLLEKYAVAVGGGLNHRVSLGDGVLIKDNHLRAAGGVAKAVAAAKARHPYRKIEVEVESRAQLQEAVRAGADIVLLDNFKDGELPALLREIPNSVTIEISGGMTPERLAALPVDPRLFVSMGFLTHHAVWADFAMDLKLAAKR